MSIKIDSCSSIQIAQQDQNHDQKSVNNVNKETRQMQTIMENFNLDRDSSKTDQHRSDQLVLKRISQLIEHYEYDAGDDEGEEFS